VISTQRYFHILERFRPSVLDEFLQFWEAVQGSPTAGKNFPGNFNRYDERCLEYQDYKKKPRLCHCSSQFGIFSMIHSSRQQRYETSVVNFRKKQKKTQVDYSQYVRKNDTYVGMCTFVSAEYGKNAGASTFLLRTGTDGR
jgi:hypothetical protein